MDLEEKKKLAAYSTVGLMFPISIAVGYVMGYFLDEWFKTSPYLTLIFVLYGVAAGFWNLYKVTKKDSNGKKNQLPHD